MRGGRARFAKRAVAICVASGRDFETGVAICVASGRDWVGLGSRRLGGQWRVGGWGCGWRRKGAGGLWPRALELRRDRHRLIAHGGGWFMTGLVSKRRRSPPISTLEISTARGVG